MIVINRLNKQSAILLKAVVFVPKLSFKLFSISRVTRDDIFGINFCKDYADVYHVQTGDIFLSGFERQGMKVFNFKTEHDTALLAFPVSCNTS